MQVREHAHVTRAMQETETFYYSRWHCCTNDDCKTALVMSDRHRVHGVPRPPSIDVEHLLGLEGEDPR